MAKKQWSGKMAAGLAQRGFFGGGGGGWVPLAACFGGMLQRQLQRFMSCPVPIASAPILHSPSSSSSRFDQTWRLVCHERLASQAACLDQDTICTRVSAPLLTSILYFCFLFNSKICKSAPGIWGVFCLGLCRVLSLVLLDCRKALFAFFYSNRCLSRLCPDLRWSRLFADRGQAAK